MVNVVNMVNIVNMANIVNEFLLCSLRDRRRAK